MTPTLKSPTLVKSPTLANRQIDQTQHNKIIEDLKITNQSHTASKKRKKKHPTHPDKFSEEMVEESFSETESVASRRHF